MSNEDIKIKIKFPLNTCLASVAYGKGKFSLDDLREKVEEYLPGFGSRLGAHLINKASPP